MRAFRIVFAGWAFYALLVALVLVEELTGAISPQLLTKPKTGLVFLDEVNRQIDWAKAAFALVAPSVVAGCGFALWRWVMSVTPDRSPLADVSAASRNSHSMPPMRVIISVLRFVRGVFYVGAVWQVLTLLPALTWLVDPSQLTGGIMGQLCLKVVALVVFSALTSMLRKLLDQLHVRAFGCPHPAFAGRRFAL